MNHELFNFKTLNSARLSFIPRIIFIVLAAVLEEKSNVANNAGLFGGLVLAIVVMFGLDTLIDHFDGHGSHGVPGDHELEASLLKGPPNGNDSQNYEGVESESAGQ